MILEVIGSNEFLEIKKKLNDILEMLSINSSGNKKDFLTGKEVKDLLKCSDSTLANYRSKGILPYTKVGGKFYYSQVGLNELFNSKKGGDNE